MGKHATTVVGLLWEAAGEEIPGYCVELAKSGRSSCKQKTKCRKQCTDVSIGFGEIRCGSLDDMSGGYTRWNHLNCWAVPAKIWLGLPDPDECDDPEQFSHALLSMNEVSLCGFSGLPEDDKATFVEYVMDKTHWAAWQNRKPKKNDAAIVPSAVGSTAAGGGGDVVPEGYHQARERFVVPVPGKDGAIAGILEGKTIVLTGVFPEVGGGRGLSLGKDKVKVRLGSTNVVSFYRFVLLFYILVSNLLQAMVQKFGGRVTSSVSGKTDYLIVGKEAGHSKVSKARESKKCIVISLKDLKEVCEGVATLEDVASKPLFIPQFSSGYGGSSALVAASGPMLIHQNGSAASDADKKPAAKRKSLEDDGDKPAAKKPKKSKAAGKKKPVKRAPKKTKEEKENVRNEESDNEDEPVKQDIKCDVCEVDCTKQSWYDEDTGEDYCVSCREGRGVLQCDGINVE